MGYLRSRISRLEKQGVKRRSILETSLKESGLSAPEWHHRRAFARATQAEREELARLHKAAQETGGATPEKDSEFYELWEKVLRREAPTLADDVRCRRDGLCRELERLEEEWTAQGRNKSTSYSDPAYWSIRGASVNRRTAVARGAPLVEDPEEIKSIVARIIDAATTDEVLVLVGWRSV